MIENTLLYIDAGSGSIVIQVIVGGLVGVGFTLKMYWMRIKNKFMKVRE